MVQLLVGGAARWMGRLEYLGRDYFEMKFLQIGGNNGKRYQQARFGGALEEILE